MQHHHEAREWTLARRGDGSMAVAESTAHVADSFVHSSHRLLIDGDWVDAASGQTFTTIGLLARHRRAFA
jgi:hypothetical protein